MKPKTSPIKVKIHWSYFRLPGFTRAKDRIGFVPCERCQKQPIKNEDCPHEDESD